MARGKQFTMTEDMLLLLRAAYVSWNDLESGAPTIDPKRPFGTQDVLGDIARLLGWPFVETRRGFDLSPQQEAKASELHTAMALALQVFLHCGTVPVGEYMAGPYDQDWCPAPKRG